MRRLNRLAGSFAWALLFQVAPAADAFDVPPWLPGDDNPTIDRMTTRGSNLGSTYYPGATVVLLGSADRLTLSDGRSWAVPSAGGYPHSTQLERVEVVGSIVRYLLFPPPYQQAIFDHKYFGQGVDVGSGVLGAAGPLVLEAVIGSATAVMRGHAVILENTPPSLYETGFHYFSAIVGSVVPFEQIYTLRGGKTWQPDTFNHTFEYTNTGVVDFAQPISVPRAVELKITGTAEVPHNASTQFTALLRHENGVVRRFSAKSAWSVEPATLGSISNGLLTTVALASPEILTLAASYTDGGAVLTASKIVLCRADAAVERPDAWPMFQANARHTGHLPVSLEPARASLRWQRALAAPVNAVAAADGRVFATLAIRYDDVDSVFALDGTTGETLWSKNVGAVHVVNPPSTAYGTVYVYAGKTIPQQPASLRAYDAVTGELFFHTQVHGQWEHYYAPTLYDGGAYVPDGYRGMFGFDASSGAVKWTSGLAGFDQWTPAVDGGLVYAYVGGSAPGLHAVDRVTGRLVYGIADPNFELLTYSLELAPVVGAHQDVLAIHDGRLLSFDTALRSIRWEIPRAFTGQPSVARNRVYAVDGGRVVVLDEQSGADLWSWQPPAGNARGAILVTDTHFLVSTVTSVYAVDLLTHESVWSVPVGGRLALALADGHLYVASSTGVLTCFAMPEATAVMSRLEIFGPAEVAESSTAIYRAFVYDTEGHSAERTLLSEWSVEPARYAAMSPHGAMTTAQLIRPEESVLVRARYVEGDRSVEQAVAVKLVAGVSVPALIRRNLEGAIRIKEGVLQDLRQALEMERAALALQQSPEVRPGPPSRRHCETSPLCLAMRKEAQARRAIRESIELLVAEALAGLSSAAPPRP